MTLKHQKDIRLINNCDAIYDEDLLKKAILWYSATPVQQSKKYFCMAIMQRFQSVEIKFTSTVL